MLFRDMLQWGTIAAAILTVSLLSACDLSSLAFVKDERVRILEPEDQGDVTLPMTLWWDVEGFTVTGRNGRTSPDAGYFAVFVDRDPIPPGKTLEWYAKEEDSCGDSPCGTVKNLAHIYPTKKTSLTLKQLPADSRDRDVERHEAVIILLDGKGARIGESAFYVRFNFQRPGL